MTLCSTLFRFKVDKTLEHLPGFLGSKVVKMRAGSILADVKTIFAEAKAPFTEAEYG